MIITFANPAAKDMIITFANPAAKDMILVRE
jgi:hypothetical protein